MKKVINYMFIVLLLVCVFAFSGCKKDDKVKIGIVQYVTHDSLDTIRDAIVKELENQGFKDGENCQIIFENGNAQSSSIASIMSSLNAKNVDVIVAIATPTAMEAIKYSDKIPVVFAAVSDPTDILASGDKVTGTSDAIQVELILTYMLQIMIVNEKSFNKLGFIYNPSEANSVTNLAKIQAYLNKTSIQLVTKTISNSSELELTAQALSEQVDAILITDDNTVASAMSVLANVANEKGIPLFCGVDSEVNDGGLLTIGINYENLGLETGKMVAKILNGENAKDIPYKVFDSNLKLFVNRKTLTTLNMQLAPYDGEVVYLEGK